MWSPRPYALPAGWRKPTEQTEYWVTRSLEFVAALPPKIAKKAKATGSP